MDVERLVDIVTQTWDELDKTPETVLDWRHHLHELVASASWLRACADEYLAETLGPGLHLIDGAEVRVSAKRPWRTGWDHDQILADLRDSRRLDRETGEIHDEPFLDRVLAVFPLGTPRMGGKNSGKLGLRDYGLRPDDYCRRDDKASVTVTR